MTLYQRLQLTRSEEDVKDVYIKALNLKGYSKNLIDIQTKEVWFEAKEGHKHSTYAMFTQLMHYVQQALNKGEYVPPLLAVIDTQKAAIMKSADVIPFLAKKTIKWGKSASGYTQEALDAVSAYIGTYFVSFKIETHEDEFISTIRSAIASGDIIRVAITPDNLKQVFDKWVTLIGQEILAVAPEEYALLFFADIMSDGTVSTHANLPAELLHRNGKPIFALGGKLYELSSHEGYRRFWAIYHRPPDAAYRNYLLERRDSLIPLDERSFKGAYYTPLHVVDKAYDKLAEVLSKNWQREYVVWDMCCGVGNLEVKHSNHRNIYMSTLDVADVDVMKATKTCAAATRFQYDYLNDDIAADGQLDYSLTNKVPAGLRKAIAEGKKMLVLINPPYAESGDTLGSDAKTKVAATKIAASMKSYGYASRELFVQFLVRIGREIPTATIAVFSKMKYVNSSNFETFREKWRATYLGGFVVHSKAFEGLKGEFPIGFLVWQTKANMELPPIAEIEVGVLNKRAEPIGEKMFSNVSSHYILNNWVNRPKPNTQPALPLKNAVLPAVKTSDVRGKFWSDGAIGQMLCDSNDPQHAGQRTAIFSSTYSSAGAFFINPENLWQVAIIFAVRRLVKPTWLNDRDQFLQPSEPLTDEFKTDCLVWMLFSGSNLTASANGLHWNGQDWRIVNHFIPFTEAEVGAPDPFESDFMVQYLEGKTFSTEAQAVLAEAKKLWRSYFGHTDSRSVRDALKLNRPDVGWYQVRKALDARNASGDFLPVPFLPFQQAYKTLTEKLQPLVYDLGFLKI
ncbi:hypothetical protein E4631_24340 [Hymenobacter sp. UV11]|uniref:hypothetical protein n=1 Tax=Hymenobacter sp. UV11 TaxID=1849735 RepID=UPI0010619E76|nr:hypothetical protein [Hymenobacter sp. UV11]TDN39901.1 hypothetical protein A8B98_16490 [Hymenobacter sp. UV11]TFZ62850.1 hypothetical protein E4631_24340 [Hymenobacter sp. UV11]